VTLIGFPEPLGLRWLRLAIVRDETPLEEQSAFAVEIEALIDRELLDSGIV